VGALREKDLERVTVDTTVQEKAIAFPTAAKLMQRARERLVRLAREHGIALRQSYTRLGKRALIMQGRYRHAKQHKRANKALRKLKTYLGRTVRDIRRKTAQEESLRDTFRRPLWLAERVSTQKRRDPLPKVYSLHAPEVECIGKGKAHKPYEFGCKVSVAATNSRPPGGQFVAHVKAFHGNPYDGHTLRQVIEEMERWTGISAERIYVDKGYQGHDYPNKHRVFRSGQKRGITPTIKKELRRRSAVEAVIGHLKSDGRLGRNFLKGRDGDKINAILAGAGYNYRLVLKWLRRLFVQILAALLSDISHPTANPIAASA
jgi:IS5 family transposase